MSFWVNLPTKSEAVPEVTNDNTQDHLPENPKAGPNEQINKQFSTRLLGSFLMSSIPKISHSNNPETLL